MVSDEALYERLLRGELCAFDALYARYEGPLYGFIRKQLRQRQEAEDVLHETFLALLRQRAQGRAATSLRAWLYQVARHLCLNRARAGHRATRALAAAATTPAAESVAPDRELLERERAESLRRAVAALPAPLGELYALRAGGLSYGELAQVLGVPLGTVKSRMHELVNRLRQELRRGDGLEMMR